MQSLLRVGYPTCSNLILYICQYKQQVTRYFLLFKLLLGFIDCDRYYLFRVDRTVLLARKLSQQFALIKHVSQTIPKVFGAQGHTTQIWSKWVFGIIRQNIKNCSTTFSIKMYLDSCVKILSLRPEATLKQAASHNPNPGDSLPCITRLL